MILSIFQHTTALIRLDGDPPPCASSARGVHA
jgi:hypothetical protein